MKTNEIKYHSAMLAMIDKFKKPKWGKILGITSEHNNVKAYFKPYKSEFIVSFDYDIFSPSINELKVGESLKKIEIQFTDLTYVLDSIYINRYSTPKFTGSITKIHTKGFSIEEKFYFQFIIPVENEIHFRFYIENSLFDTDLDYRSNQCTKAKIEYENFDVCCIKTKKNDYFLVIDSSIKQTYKEFSEKVYSICIGLGYITGHYPGNKGYFFAYSNRDKKEFKHFQFTHLRKSINLGFSPIYVNAYPYIRDKGLAEKYQNLIRPVSIIEFSKLCDNINSSIEFQSTLMLILESSEASLLFRPGGYAIALETLSDIIIGDLKLKLAPIKDKTLAKNIRKAFTDILDENSASIDPDDIKTLKIRIDQFNQITNKSRLKAPFDLQGIELLKEDLDILETRNDFLHGRVPDITKAGEDRSLDRINKDLYYASIRLYTLLNILILKWIGYDNRVLNIPKIHEGFTGIYLDEEPFRLV